MKEKRKIALVVSHPIQHFCPQYVSFAENQRIQFKVFFGSRLGLEKYVDINFQQEISWSNLNIDRFEHEFVNGSAVLQSDKNLDAPGLDKALEVFKPDLVITYGYFQKLQRRAYRWAREKNIPLAYISDSELRHKRSRWKSLLKAPLLRRYFSGIQFFLTVGDANEAFYKHYRVPAEKMIRMHFPIDIKMYESSWGEKQLLGERIRKEYAIPDGDIVLSTVGKLVSWKNQDHIINALQLLEKEGKYFHLFILGSGEMSESWKQKASGLVKSRVYFPGFVNIESLPAYYAASDIYVHAAAVEPHSIAVSEAIYMGCPVIISDTCGSYGQLDDVQEGHNGYTFRFGDIEHLSVRMKQLAEGQVLRQAFGKYSHKIAVSFQHNAHYAVIEKLDGRLNALKKAD